MREIPGIYYDLITALEGDRLTSYQDPGGKWTIGRGHTGPEVSAGLVIDEAESFRMCVVDSTAARTRLYGVAPEAVLDSLADHQFAALLSFVYNLGADPKWTIWKDLRTGNLDDVPTQMLRFDKMHDEHGEVVTVPGLEHRRLAEKMFWLTPDVTAAARTIQAAPVPPPPSSYTRTASTPPSPSLPPVSSVRSKTKWAAVAVAGLGSLTALQTMVTSVQGSIDGAGLSVSWLPAFDHYCGIAVAVLGGLIWVIRDMDERAKQH